jgi:TolB-like protein/Flp pilus assembly protein TadD
MAPEQLEGLAADVRSDIFSLGVTLYEMITRRRPFHGDEPGELAASIQSSPSRSITELRAGVPAGLVRLVNGCLEREPAARWQTAQELVTQLKSITPRHRSKKGPWLLSGAAAAVVLAAGAWYWRDANAPSITSIAVLPFTNATPQADTEYLTDGITESIINSLSSARRLKVIARTTAFTFKGKEIDPQAVGRQLGVEAVLTGRISQRGDSIEIQTDLAKVADRSQLWGEHFRRKIADIQSLQAEIAAEIADNLHLRLTGEDRKRVTRRYTESNEAFQLYLRTMHEPTNPPGKGLLKRIQLLEQAIGKDPGFARAYVQLAESYRWLSATQVWPAARSLEKSRAAATKAMELDPGLGEAHVELANSLWWGDWDRTGAEREFQRGLELNANSAHVEYGKFLAQIGRTQEARMEARRAIEIDPLSSATLGNVAYLHWMTRDYDQAKEDVLSAPNRDVLTAFVHEAKGEYQEAIAEFEKLGETAGIRGHPGRVYIQAGRLADGRRILGQLQVRVRKDGVGAYEIAFIHAALGNIDEAFQWLDVAYRNRDAGLKFLKVDPAVDVLRSDPRLQELERRVGLAQ